MLVGEMHYRVLSMIGKLDVIDVSMSWAVDSYGELKYRIKIK